MSKRKFKVGDRVTAFGLKGTVMHIAASKDYSITVKYDSGDINGFTSEGMYLRSHAKPSLKHLKTKKKPRLECYVNVYPDGLTGLLYLTRKQAKKYKHTAALEVGVRMVRAKDQKRGGK